MKFYDGMKKIISGATGITLMFTSLGINKAVAKEDVNKNLVQLQTIDASLEEQERDMKLEDYVQLVQNAYAELASLPNFNMYDGIILDIQCLVYMRNIADIKKSGLEDELIAKGYIHYNNLAMVGHAGQYDYKEVDADGWFNVNAADRLINQINDYYHQTISTEICTPIDEENVFSEEGPLFTNMYDEYLDTIVGFESFAFRDRDKEISREIANNVKDYGKALVSGDDEKILETLQTSHRALTSLNANKDGVSNTNASLGNAWFNLRIFGLTQMFFTESKMLMDYPAKTLGEFYEKDTLNAMTFIPRFDKAIEYNRISDLMLRNYVETDITMFNFALNNSSNEIFNLMGYKCVTPEELEATNSKTK